MKIFLIGFMGSGKTHWGRLISQKLNVPFFDLDEQIVTHEEKSVNEIFANEGEEYFRLCEKDVLHIITESHDTFVMACGGGTPCYYNNIEYMNDAGTTVWINTSAEILHERLLKEKSHRPLLKDLSDDQLKSFIMRKYADRRIFYEQADVVIDDETISLDEFLQKIFHA